MATDHQALVRAVLDAHGRTFCDELGIDVGKNTPPPLFRLLVAAHLLSANIDAHLGLRAARALTDAGYRTARRLAEATDAERHDVLEDARFLRKERTADLLGRTAQHCVERWGGDLRRLRAEVDGDVARARELVQEFDGVGPVGADIVLREVQVTWTEFAPFLDDRAKDGASSLGLPRTPDRLAELAGDGPTAFARLACALVRVELEGDAAEVRAAARG